MAQGRGRLEWNQTAEILAMLYNVNRPEKAKALKGDDFNPYTSEGTKATKQAEPVLISKAEGFSILKALFRKNVNG